MDLRRFGRLAACVAAAAVLSAGVASHADARKPQPPADRTPPSQPTGLHVTAVTQTSVTLAWNPSADNVGVRSYSLWGEGLDGVVSVDHPQTTATWTRLLRPGQTVTFHVTAFDAMYNASTPSAGATATTVADTTPPSDPSGLTLGATTASSVLLTWNSGTDQFNPVQTEILVNGVPTDNAFSLVVAGTNPRPAVQSAWVRQLDPSTTYQFAVRAVDPSGNRSGLSNVASATTSASTDTVAPSTPTLVTAFSFGTSSCPEELWLDWTDSTDPSPSSGLEYEIRVNGRIVEVIGNSADLIYTEVAGTNTVTIVAVDLAGNASAPSNAVDVFVNLGPGGCVL
jgi:cellulose 1,4-beta-cellobiosidase